MRSTIQVDLDSLWTYHHYLNRAMPDMPADPVYSQSLQYFLELFAKYDVKATFFIIGKDAQNPEHVKQIKTIAEQGHEIANHSMNHLPDFGRLSPETIKQEILESHALLKSIIKKDPVGFRAPMFSVNEQVIGSLDDLGYKYDASVIPSRIFPLLMNAAHSLLRLKPVNLRSGDMRFAKAPRSVYNPAAQDIVVPGDMRIKQVPVGISDFFGFPMHSTYVFTVGEFLFDSGLDHCLKKDMDLHYLFHGIDLLDISRYSINLPGFKSWAQRRDICERIVKKIVKNSNVMTVEQLIAI